MSKLALLIFTKNPEAGKVKTRLAASIGDDEALAVYHQLLFHTVSATEQLSVDKFVFYSDYIEQKDAWNSKHYHKEVQQGADLGERMKNAFTSAFQKGYGKVVIIGTDCPGLNAEIIQSTFNKLDDDLDVVIGPAFDGGYYLIGLKQMHQTLFENIDWSTANVFPETIRKCKTNNLLFFLMPLLHDIDEEKDLVYLNKTIV